MTYRNLLLLGLSSIALQGCIAAAALPIVAGSGALVRNGVSDDARSGSRESVTVVTPPPPAPSPSPTPAQALASTEPAEPVATAAEPMAAATPAQLASSTPEPVIVATLGDAPQGPELAPTPTPAPLPSAAPAEAAMAVSQMPDEPVAAAPEPSPPAEELAATQVPEEPAAAALTPEPPAARIADVGLPPEPAAPDPAPALAAATPVAQPPAAAAPDPVEPAATETVEAEASEQAFVSAEPPVEPPAGPSPETVFGQPVAGTGYDALAGYALRTLGGGLPLPSAMLADPTSLQPIRRDCQGNAPTVVIDLDPAGGVVPIAGPLPLNNELARILADLRLRDVQIAWITDRGPIDARAVRDRLVASGLDPASQDALYVERYPGETKQSRRTALAQTRCVIALAGDERSDFDDLYNFVRDLNDARSLEMMLGNGWFLIPNPVGD